MATTTKTTTKKAPDVSTAAAIRDFPATVKAHATKAVGDADRLRDLVARCRAAAPPILGEDRVGAFVRARARTLADLLAEYLTARLTAKYPRLDPALFKLRRHLTLSRLGVLTRDATAADQTPKKRDWEVARLNVPLFAAVPLDGDRRCELGRHTFRRRDRWSDVTRTTVVTVRASRPDVPTAVRIQAHAALSFYHRVLGEAYADPDLGATLAAVGPAAPTLGVIWIPTPASLSVSRVDKVVPRPRRNDPAVTLNVGADRYLVALYDVPDEEPFERYLREFSAGDNFPAKTAAPK